MYQNQPIRVVSKLQFARFVTYFSIRFCRNITSNPYHLQCALVRSSFNGSQITLIITSFVP
jgi:hypothetical protein